MFERRANWIELVPIVNHALSDAIGKSNKSSIRLGRLYHLLLRAGHGGISRTAANSGSYAARSMRISISLRSVLKSIGLVTQRLRAALQSLTLGLRIAVGRNHDDRHIRPRRFRLR